MEFLFPTGSFDVVKKPEYDVMLPKSFTCDNFRAFSTPYFFMASVKSNPALSLHFPSHFKLVFGRYFAEDPKAAKVGCAAKALNISIKSVLCIFKPVSPKPIFNDGS